MTPEEKLIAEFRKKFGYIEVGGGLGKKNLNSDDINLFILKTHRTAREEGRREGLEDIRKEILGLREEHDCGQNVDYPADQCTPTCGHNHCVDLSVALIDARLGK